MIDTRKKIVAADQLSAEGDSTVIAVGRFDVIRAEHCRLLQEARSKNERLVAAVLTDSDENSSLLDQQSRAQLTAALAAVDQVVICSSAEAKQLAVRIAASAVLDVDSRLQRELIADVLKRQSTIA